MSKSTEIVKRKSLAVSVKDAAKYAKASKADNTKRAYSAAWQAFADWCADNGALALPAEVSTVIGYLTALAEDGVKLSTIGVKRAAISFYHRAEKESDPTAAEDVRIVMAGIARALGRASQKKAPVTLDELRKLVATMPDSLVGKRDRALVLVGWGGAFRRSELVALDVGDIRLNDELKITIRKSKTDQEGQGMTKTIPALEDKTICPVVAMRAWLDAAELKSGAIFRRVDRWGHMRDERLTAQSVSLILKAAATRAKIDPRQFSGHSLRSGFITTASNAGAEERDIAAVSGHKSLTVLRGYIQDAGLGARRAVSAAFGSKPIKRPGGR